MPTPTTVLSKAARAVRRGGLSVCVAAALLLVGLLTVPTSASAQRVTGQITEVDTGRDVVGALVVLEDLRGEEVARQISNIQGRYLFQVDTPGEYRVRVERIGARTFTSSSVRIPETGSVRFDLVAPLVIFELEALRAEGAGRCEVRPEEGVPAHRLWEEARKALEITRMTIGSGQILHDLVRFERLYTPNPSGELKMRGELVGSRQSPEPFESRPAIELVRDGFVQAADGSTEFFMPDPTALLSDAFLDSHCFRAVFPGVDGEPTRDDGNEVGVRFEPLDLEGVPDVDGVLWLDATDAGLRVLEYRYVGGGLENFDPSAGMTIGGRAEFERLPDGRWIVSRWSIVMPETLSPVQRGAVRITRRAFGGFREVGGQVVGVIEAPRGNEVWSPPRPARLAGVVYDSLTAAPMRGGSVRLLGDVLGVPVDSVGRFSLDGLPEGEVALVVDHPLQNQLLLDPHVVRFELNSGSNTAELATRSAYAVFERYCPDEVGDDRGLLSVFVVDAESGAPVADAELWVRTPRRGNRNRGRRIYEIHRESPAIHVCDIWVDIDITLEVHRDGEDPVVQEFRFEPGLRLGVLTIPVEVSNR